uniref:Uncharacterized protein n=1 Tax=Steinernema glaseri TaxID=37863 RepID=A0A1I8A9H8_9BILA
MHIGIQYRRQILLPSHLPLETPFVSKISFLARFLFILRNKRTRLCESDPSALARTHKLCADVRAGSPEASERRSLLERRWPRRGSSVLDQLDARRDSIKNERNMHFQYSARVFGSTFAGGSSHEYFSCNEAPNFYFPRVFGKRAIPHFLVTQDRTQIMS